MKDVAIIGSCVSRDPFEVDAESRPGIRFYAARTSFASAFCGTHFPLSLAEIDTSGLVKSAWQRRMVEQDLSKNLVSSLKSLTAGDTVIIDFIDERFDLMLFKGSIATCSAEFKKAVVAMKRPTGLSLLPSGSEEHRRLWQIGFSRFAKIASDLGLQVIVNNCLWAERDENGAANSNQALIARFNAHLKYMYDFAFANSDYSAVFPDGYEFISAVEHKWQPAPFHFSDSVYRDFNRRIDAILAEG